jgi:hypothetical protein
MTMELKSLVRKILSTHPYYQKLYVRLIDTIDEDVDYFYESLSRLIPEFQNQEIHHQADLIVFCCSAGFRAVRRAIRQCEQKIYLVA